MDTTPVYPSILFCEICDGDYEDSSSGVVVERESLTHLSFIHINILSLHATPSFLHRYFSSFVYFMSYGHLMDMSCPTDPSSILDSLSSVNKTKSPNVIFCVSKYNLSQFHLCIKWNQLVGHWRLVTSTATGDFGLNQS